MFCFYLFYYVQHGDVLDLQMNLIPLDETDISKISSRYHVKGLLIKSNGSKPVKRKASFSSHK